MQIGAIETDFGSFMSGANTTNLNTYTDRGFCCHGLTRYKALIVASLLLIPRLGHAATSRNTYEWTSQAPMRDARSGSCSARLPDGRILVTGGSSGGDALTSVEMLGVNQAFSNASPMATPRQNHICAVLPDGSLLVAGGTTTGGGITNAAEIYDPKSGRWDSTQPMSVARTGATATTLNDGRVLIAGGNTAVGP